MSYRHVAIICFGKLFFICITNAFETKRKKATTLRDAPI